MSVLLSVNNYFYRRGGAEVVFLEQNRLFEQIDWQVVPFAMRHPDNFASDWDRHFIDEIEFGQHYSLPQKLLRAQKIAYSFEARRRIAQLLDEAAPDIAHAHNIYHHISPAIFGVLKRRGIPTVLTLHDFKLGCPAYKMMTHDGVCERCSKGAIWNVVRHRCIKDSLVLSTVVLLEAATQRALRTYRDNVDRMVAPSRFLLEKMVEWGWPRERFTHIPNFVDADALAPRGLPGKRFVYCGRLDPQKGVATFIHALAEARVPGLVIGSGAEQPQLQALAEQLQVDVKFAGHQTGQTLFDLLGQARAVVLPSEWYENAPISILEAYALERPVIGADIGGIPELIRDGETGALFRSGDRHDLARQMRRFADMPDTAILAMGRAARRWVIDNFSAARYRQRLLDLYRGCGVDC